jgi:multimeric flavodoxin WrbA
VARAGRAHRARREATLDDLEWANAYLFSAPTRYGAAASQMRAFLDQTGPLWGTGKLANKAASAMSSAQNPHGGQETTVQAFNNMFATGARSSCRRATPTRSPSSRAATRTA